MSPLIETLTVAASHPGAVIAASVTGAALAIAGYFGFRIVHDHRNAPRVAAAELRCAEALAAISYAITLPVFDARKFMNTFLHGDPRMVVNLWPDWPDWRDRYIAVEMDTRL